MVVAYFAPSLAMLRRIFGVARRGKARIVTAAKSDNRWTIGAARFFYWRLLKRGAEIFEYQPTKLHTKLFVVDDVVHIGSANFDMRSLFLNLEMMLRVDDAGLRRGDARIRRRRGGDSEAITARGAPQGADALRNRMRWWLGLFPGRDRRLQHLAAAQFRASKKTRPEEVPIPSTPRTGGGRNVDAIRNRGRSGRNAGAIYSRTLGEN